MPADQHTAVDPTTKHDQPNTGGAQIAHPGLTADMPEQPDHGEDSYRGSGRLTGRKAVITGGDSGIGRAVAIAFAREGADVLISYLPAEEDDAKVTAELIRAAGQVAVTVPGDLREEQHCSDVIDTAVRELGGVDILVNNAAYQHGEPDGLAGISTEEFDRVMKTNLYAMFWLCKYAVKHLQPGSSIINTSSVQATTPSPELIDYALSKAAIVNFTKSLSASLAEQGIRVNSVAPGPIWTPLIPATMSKEKVDSHGTETPLGRAGQPAEVAPAYVFLASGEASYITGQTIGVTGGKPTN